MEANQFSPRKTLAETLKELKVSHPIKWNFTVQVLESRVLKACFNDKKKHEPLRLQAQEEKKDARIEKICNLIDPAYALKESNFENNQPKDLQELLQVKIIHKTNTRPHS